METRKGPASDDGAGPPAGLVILDGFPESLEARSAFFRLVQFHGVVFLALNASPHAMRFLRVNALTRLKIIDRDPAPKALISAIVDLVRGAGKSPARHPGTVLIKKRDAACTLNLDEPVKNPGRTLYVTPAQAGIQCYQ